MPVKVYSFDDMKRAVPTMRFDMAKLNAMTPGQQAHLRAQLQEWDRRRKVNPLTRYRPASQQHYDAHMARVDTRLVAGGNRSGKTTWGMADTLIQMAPLELLPDHLRQFKRGLCPFYCRCVGPDLERWLNEVMAQKVREWCPTPLLAGGSWERSFDKAGRRLQLSCGCRFDFLSYEMDLDKFGGTERDRLWYDEEPPEPIRVEGLWRLIDRAGDEILTMTPQKGLTWSFRKVWRERDKPVSAERPRSIRAWAINTRSNDFADSDEVAKAVAGTTNAQEVKQRLEGTYAELGGEVYGALSGARVRRPQRWPEHLRGMDVIGAIDPGIRYAGLVWTGFDRDNVGLTFAARKLENKAAHQYIAAIERVQKDCGLFTTHGARIRSLRYVIDPSARNRELATGSNVQAELAALGLHTTPAQNDVETGIMHIRRRLDSRMLFVLDDLDELLDEAVEYAFEEREDEEFDVVKRNDHCLDAWRYGLMERLWTPGKVAVRVDPNDQTVAQPAPRREPRRHRSVAGAMV